MKRTFSANIDGQVFNIDEDAFIQLQNYLQQLKLTFTGAEGAEIVADIESRIRELFTDQLQKGKYVITLQDVNAVIETMGRPEDLSDSSEPNTENPEATPTATGTPTARTNKKLFRNLKDKVFGGVLGGLATYFGWNANIMRLLVVLLVICTTGILHMWPFVVAYLIAWMVIPPAVTPRQILQMHGEPVNIDTVGQTVMANSPVATPPAIHQGDFFNTCFSIIGKFILGLVAIVTGIVSATTMVVFVTIAIGMLLYAVADVNNILVGMSMFQPEHHWWAAAGAGSLTMLCITIFFGTLCWGSLAAISNIRRPSRFWLITLLIAFLMLIVVTAILWSMAA